MKIPATVAITMEMLLAMTVHGQGGEKIQVYLNAGNVANTVLFSAKDTAGRMLATAGVALEWRIGAPRPGLAPGDQPSIVIDFSENTAETDHPGALAYSRLYEGVHIRVLYDRIKRVPVRLWPALLAHVMAHELGHLFEAVARHSSSGVMKARWDSNDYRRMLKSPLPFAAEDIVMIQRGTRARATWARSVDALAAAGAELPE